MNESILESYHEQGYAGPIRGIDRDHAIEIAAWINRELDAVSASYEDVADDKDRQKVLDHERLLTTRNRHLDYQPLADLLKEKRIMEPIFDIIGPAVSLWRTQFFDMNGRQGLGWHTDEYRAILDPIDEQLSAQIAFTPSSEKNCVWVLPGSHRLDDSEISERFDLEYAGGREGVVYGTSKFEERGRGPEPVRMVLDAGEFFIFHPLCLHRSSRHRSRLVRAVSAFGKESRRLAMAFRFASARTSVSEVAFTPTEPRRDSCVLVNDPRVAS